jgi:chromosome segregation ATPase
LNADLAEMLERLASIEAQLDRVEEALKVAQYGDAATKAAVDEILARINAATNDIAAKIAALTAQLTQPGLNEAEVTELKAQLETLQGQLEALAADPENPVP